MATPKELKIDKDEIFRRFDYDPESGIITWKELPDMTHKKKTMAHGMPAFTTRERKGYMNGRVMGVHLKAHRVAWLLHYGDWPHDQIDHINRNKSDNRISNLRVVSNHQNCRNQAKRKENTSGWNGVSFNKNLRKWHAKYRMFDVDYHVGFFQCPTSAGIAVMKARIASGFDPSHGFNI